MLVLHGVRNLYRQTEKVVRRNWFLCREFSYICQRFLNSCKSWCVQGLRSSFKRIEKCDTSTYTLLFKMFSGFFSVLN